MKTLKFISLFLLIFALLIVFIPDANAQCPMCKASVESGMEHNGSKVGLGLNDGILYLLSVPYLALGFIGWAWYRSYRKNKAARYS